MLKKFAEIDHKCFKNFKWSTLPELSRFNLFYGWNGTGKTTLSNLLFDLERKNSVETGKVIFRIDEMDVFGSQLAQSNQPLPKFRVFNQKYIEKSVLSKFDNLEHIVFFGEKSVEHEQQRLAAVDEQAKLREEYKTLQRKKHQVKSDLESYKQSQALSIKNLLRTPGNDEYTNYNKTNFENRCESFNTDNDVALSDTQRDDLLTTIRTDLRQTLTIQRQINPVSEILIETIFRVLSTSPISVAIENLKNDSPLAAWVGEGLQLHKHRDNKNCLFCENPLGEDRIKRLEQHFDTSFLVLSQQLNDSLMSIQQLKINVDRFKPYPSASVYPQLVARLDVLNAIIETKKVEFIKLLHAVEASLKAKQMSMFIAVDVPSELSKVFSGGEALCVSANDIETILAEHNRITSDFKPLIEGAKAQLEADLIGSSIATYKSKKDSEKSVSEAFIKCETRGHELTELIKALEAKLTETAAPAESLNRDLSLYLGHGDLTLTDHGQGYALKRGIEPARDLSEGEKTAFALLYFLKTLEDHRGRLEETIVVIDDPVSSLDASALFTAFGFIKERTENAKQIIIFTHDFSFFGLVKGWFQHPPKGASSQFYSLKVFLHDDGKFARITEMDKLLKDYASEYQYLFHLVKNGSLAEGKDLSELYGLPNVGRRLIEHFISFKFPGGKGTEKLMARMEKLELDSKTLALLNRFLNIHSHGDGIAQDAHDLNLLAETPKVMQAILAAMRCEDEEHVKRLEMISQPLMIATAKPLL